MTIGECNQLRAEQRARLTKLEAELCKNTTDELREQIADIVIKYVPATSVMAESQKTARESAIEQLEQLISNREKLARIDELELAQSAWLETSLVDHMNTRLSTLRKELDGEKQQWKTS